MSFLQGIVECYNSSVILLERRAQDPNSFNRFAPIVFATQAHLLHMILLDHGIERPKLSIVRPSDKELLAMERWLRESQKFGEN